MPDADQAERFAGLAAQYGPFFFSVLFVLFVPVLGQSWFSATLNAKIKDPDEKQRALAVYRFYWMSGVVTGLLLVAVSITWWGYVQLNYVLPVQQAAVDARISDAINKRIFEGTIKGVSPDDMFINDFANPDYHLYFYPIPNQIPLTMRYAIIFKNIPKDIPTVAFDYIDRPQYELLAKEGGRGGVLQRISLCLGSSAKEMFVIRVPPSSIRFDIQCEHVRR
jgi:hypothetical protein